MCARPGVSTPSRTPAQACVGHSALDPPQHIPRQLQIPRINFVRPGTRSPNGSEGRLSADELQVIGFNGEYLTPLSPDVTLPLDFETCTPGFRNDGNTCYLSAAVQCLLHSKPFVAALLADNHETGDGIDGFCVLCELKKLVRAVHRNGAATDDRQWSMSLTQFSRKVMCIGNTFQRGHQQDAHELLRCLLELVTRALIYGCHGGSALYNGSKYIRLSEEYGTLVHQVYGGCLQSSVTCIECGNVSRSYEPFLDLCVDLSRGSSVYGALLEFCRTETLSPDNKCFCPRCKVERNIQKKLSIRRAPLELAIQLKRFSGNNKNNRLVLVEEQLDLSPFMESSITGSSGSFSSEPQPITYSLQSVLVHAGPSASSGHYYAYVKEHGQWYRKDDSFSTKVTLEDVLRDEAYVLFYLRDDYYSRRSDSSDSSDSSSGSDNPPAYMAHLKRETKMTYSHLAAQRSPARQSPARQPPARRSPVQQSPVQQSPAQRSPAPKGARSPQANNSTANKRATKKPLFGKRFFSKNPPNKPSPKKMPPPKEKRAPKERKFTFRNLLTKMSIKGIRWQKLKKNGKMPDHQQPGGLKEEWEPRRNAGGGKERRDIRRLYKRKRASDDYDHALDKGRAKKLRKSNP